MHARTHTLRFVLLITVVPLFLFSLSLCFLYPIHFVKIIRIISFAHTLPLYLQCVYASMLNNDAESKGTRVQANKEPDSMEVTV